MMSPVQYFFVRLVIAIFEYYLAVYLYRVYWKRREASGWRRFITPLALLLMAASALPAVAPYSSYFTFAFVFLMSFLYEMTWLWHLLGLSLYMVIMAVGESVMVACIILLTGLETIEQHQVWSWANPWAFFFGVFLTKLLFLLMLRLIAWIRKGRVLPNDFRLSLLALACPVVSYMIILAMNSMRLAINDRYQTILSLIVLWLLFFATVLVVNLVERLAHVQCAQREQELAGQALEEESARYRQALRQHSETARAMHDVRNRLAVGMGLLYEGDTEAAYEVIEKVVDTAGDTPRDDETNP